MKDEQYAEMVRRQTAGRILSLARLIGTATDWQEFSDLRVFIESMRQELAFLEGQALAGLETQQAEHSALVAMLRARGALTGEATA